MKSRYWILLAALTLLFAPFVTAGDGEETEPPEDKQEIFILTGGQDSDTDGSLQRVAEYQVVEPNPLLGLKWRTSPYEDSTMGLEIFRVDSREYKAAVELDLKRKLRITGTLDGFLHRLVHDSIDNLQAVSEIKVVQRTDYEPGRDYSVNNSIFNILAEFQPPSTPGFSFRGGYKQLDRKGHRQMLSTSHCTSCHTTSQGREVDERISDSLVGVHLATGKVDIDYEVYGSQFSNSAATPMAPYETALHPGSGGAFFDDRVWFQGNAAGPVDYPVNVIPDVERLGHKLKARAGFGTTSAINFTAVQSKTENKRTNLQYEFGALRGRYSTKLGKKWRLNVYANHDELKNDNVFIDLVALNGLTGAPTETYPGGLVTTFQDWRRSVDGDPNLTFNSFTRYSAMNRTTDRIGVDAVWRVLRRASLRLGYKFRRVDRDNVVLAGGDGVTTSQTLKAGWNQRWRNRVRWNNSVWYTATDNPYGLVDGGLRLFGGDSGAAGSPKVPASLQYYQLHELRAANLANKPSKDFRLRSNFSWGPRDAHWSIGANVRYRDAENDELNYTEWSRDNIGAGVNFWIAAAPKVSVMVGLDAVRQRTNSEVIVPVMDG